MFIYGLLVFLFLWLVVLSFITYKTKKHYHKLLNSTKKGQIDSILDKLVDNDDNFEVQLANIKKEIGRIEEVSKTYLQRWSLVRYNPFERIGGEQSFVLALLDHEKNGLVINFIYTREGIRTYTKTIRLGKGHEYELSEEEKEAIKKACN